MGKEPDLAAVVALALDAHVAARLQADRHTTHEMANRLYASAAYALGAERIGDVCRLGFELAGTAVMPLSKQMKAVMRKRARARGRKMVAKVREAMAIDASDFERFWNAGEYSR